MHTHAHACHRSKKLRKSRRPKCVQRRTLLRYVSIFFSFVRADADMMDVEGDEKEKNMLQPHILSLPILLNDGFNVSHHHVWQQSMQCRAQARYSTCASAEACAGTSLQENCVSNWLDDTQICLRARTHRQLTQLTETCLYCTGKRPRCQQTEEGRGKAYLPARASERARRSYWLFPPREASLPLCLLVFRL
jgi:hypothetical protein